MVNPFVDELTFPDTLTRMRRDHMKYLTLIRAIALLHQHQRPLKHEHGIDYIEVQRADIEAADRLFGELMRCSLDELPPRTRRLLELIVEMVNGREDFRFSRRDVRAYTNWGHSQLKVHLHRLEEMEYLAVHQGGRGQIFVYELNWPGLEEDKPGPGRAHAGGMSGLGRTAETSMKIGANGVFHLEMEKHMLVGV